MLQPCQLQHSSTFTCPTTGTAKYDLKQPNNSTPVILESGALADDPISEPEGPEPSVLSEHPLPEDPEGPENPLPEELLLQEGLPMPLSADPLLAPLPEPIEKGLVSHRTVCYLTRRGEEEYIIKDHWVLGGKEDMLNEVIMLNEMKGVCGIPKLVEHWLVKIAPREVDETEKYRYKTLESIEGTFCTHIQLVLKPHAQPLHMFCTKAELVSAIRDIITIQKIAVKERGILHQDCSLNNSMIEDNGNGSHGTMIDWEFAVHILQSNYYLIGGMGTVPFMSWKLLHQLS
ncbi:uncharacterized protein EDB93DRAFT_1256318 [Suillus bovinus]|uniref:uncharacterized protein n=1 Tax=Suillus bovinus TaxID=48563 RepID=UPI001B8725DC|nr:uncharacterized protein EDB93DRAFT_1256318 [Suillus bovinus]KAG2129255.1 hypothetical protein EDB93DRAFT_1256318 [Suillus bovinus]